MPPAKTLKPRPSFVVLSRGKGCDVNVTRRLEQALQKLDQASDAWQQGRHGDAIRLLKEAIDIEQACLGPDSAAVATALPQLGAYLLIAGEFAEAETVLQRGIALLANYPVREKEAVAARALLAELYLKTGRPAEAEATIAEVLPLGERAFGAGSVEVARLLHTRGLAQECLGEHEAAAASFGRALSLCESGPDREHLEAVIPAILGSLVRVSFALGRNEKAMEYLDRLLLQLPDDDTHVEVDDDEDF